MQLFQNKPQFPAQNRNFMQGVVGGAPLRTPDKANFKNQEVSMLDDGLISNSNKSVLVVPISVAQIQAPLDQKSK